MSEKQVIATDGAPQNDAPYSQGILIGDFLFVSGQGPRDPDSMDLVLDSIEAQTERTLENVEAILTDSGGALPDVVKTTVYLGDMEDYDAMNDVYGRYFSEDPPARVCIEAGRLPNDIGVEIEAIARID